MKAKHLYFTVFSVFCLIASPFLLTSKVHAAEGTLVGTVTEYGTGFPLEGVYVNATRPGQYYQTSTNISGKYELKDLPPGDYNVTTYHPDYINQTILVTIVASSTTTKDFIIEAYQQVGWLEGNVVESSTLLALEGVYVNATSNTLGYYGQTTTNSSGKYRLELLVGDYNVTTYHPDYINQTTPVTISSYTAVTQDFIMQQKYYKLIIEVIGLGSTAPPPGSHTMPTNEIIPVEAIPEPGWQLHHWILDSIVQEPIDPIPIPMQQNHEVIAFFTEINSELFIESCNIVGDQKDIFELHETLYVTGNNFAPSSNFDLYLVENVESWAEGMSIPQRVEGTLTTVTSNEEGWIPPTIAWPIPDTIGHYDIIVDINQNGEYEPEIDALDNNDIEVTDGFQIIPEISALATLTLFTTATFIGYYLETKQYVK